MSHKLLFTAVTALILLLKSIPALSQVSSFNMSVAGGCAPLSVSFSSISTGSIISQSWDLGNGNFSQQPNASTIYANPGTYQVTLLVVRPGGTDTVRNSIVVYDKPVVSFSGINLAGCAPDTVQFTSAVIPNSTGTLKYLWYFGDGNIDSISSVPSHAYTTAGSYTVALTVTNGAGCPRLVFQNGYVTVYPVPQPTLSGFPLAFCGTPANVAFSSTVSSGTSPFVYNWDYGDGGTGTGSAGSHAYNSGGQFSVRLTVVDSHQCMGIVARSNYVAVNDTPATIIGPRSRCLRQMDTFINGTAGVGYTHWDFGDGDTAIGLAVHHAHAVGTYIITMQTEIGACVKTDTQSLTVHSLPTGTITQFPSIPCPPPSVVRFTGNSPTAIHYAWSWQSGGIDSGQIVTKTYNVFRGDQVLLTLTDANGCTATISDDTIQIRDPGPFVLPHPIGVKPVAGCVPFNVTFDFLLGGPSNPYPGYATSTFWQFGDGDTSTQPRPQHTYLNRGNYTLSLTVVTNNGCTATSQIPVHVDTPVIPFFTASPLVVCAHSPVIYSGATPNSTTGTIYGLFVRNINGVDDTGFAPISTDTFQISCWIKKPGIYDVGLYSSNFGCIDTFHRYRYITVNSPGAGFSSVIACSPSRSVSFTDTSYQADAVLWNFGDLTTDTVRNPVHVFPDTGNYMVRQIAYNNVSGCIDTAKQQIHIQRSVADFTSSFTGACTKDVLYFYGTFIGPDTARYSFIFDTYQSAYTEYNQAAVSYDSTGYHDVTMVVTSGNNCRDTVKKHNAVLIGRPKVRIVPSPPVGCEPLFVTLADSSSNAPGLPTVRRVWSAGPGDTLIINSPVITRTYTKGRYALYLQVTDSLGCVGSFVDTAGYIYVLKPAAALRVTKDSLCIGALVTFKDTSVGVHPFSYAWDYGDGTKDTGYTATHRYSTTGEYTATLIVSDSLGCRDTASRHISVKSPTASYSMSDSFSICPTKAIFFFNTSVGATNYSWNFGNGGGPVLIPNPSCTYTGPGVYNVYLVAYNSYGCTDTARSKVRVLGYNGAFNYSPTEGCAPMLVQFNPPVTTIPAITWDFADGNIITTPGTGTSHVYLNPGPYRPKAIFSDGTGCTAFDSGLTVIHVDSVTVDFSWTIPCADTPFILTQSSGGFYNAPIHWYWLFGGGDEDTGRSVSHKYLSPGNHAVTLIAENVTGCRDTITKDVFINPLPIVNATDDTAVCPGDKVTLTVTGAMSYLWTPSGLITCLSTVCDSVTVQPPGASVYYVSGTDSNNCINKDSVRVIIQIKTTNKTGPDGEICLGESYLLKASGAHHYTWTPASTLNDSTSATPIATPSKTTTYTVAAQEGTCLINYTNVTVIVHSLPIFSAGNDETIVRGGAVTLHPTQKGISRIEWMADTTLSCSDCFLPNAHPRYTRTYYATGYNEYGCKVTDSVTVFVHCNGDLVFVPNTFSPNNDGKNDFFFPRGEGVDRMTTFRVFNRWGEMVFERNNLALNDERAGWDGTYQGKILPPDVYVYTMQSRCEDGELVKWKGDVTLMR